VSVADRAFGVSTRLFHDTPLTRDHLVHIAAHQFDLVELYATRAHFDCLDRSAIAQLSEWLADTRLQLHAVHAEPGAGADDLLAGLQLAQSIPYRFLVMHRPASGTEKTLQAVTQAAAAVGVGVVLEVLHDRGSSPQALVTLIEDELEDLPVGICFDCGHANLLGDVGEALEITSGHLQTMHLHDNNGRRDDHLLPYRGTIEWEVAMMETQKIGYDGAMILELAPDGDPATVLANAARVRQRLEKALL
jgi:sugar phosphate isomerase/epimerase